MTNRMTMTCPTVTTAEKQHRNLHATLMQVDEHNNSLLEIICGQRVKESQGSQGLTKIEE